MMVFNDTIILLSGTETKDKYGNLKFKLDKKRTLPCNFKSLSRYDFYNSNSKTLRSSFIVTINTKLYKGESLLEYDKKIYKIVRVYEVNWHLTELTIEEAEGLNRGDLND